jgi:hypothetical protein
VSNKLKEDVPDSVQVQARLMARKELEARLAELNMTSAGADSYGALLAAVQAHIAQLRDLLERAFLPCFSPACTLIDMNTTRPGCPGGRTRLGEAPD